MTRRGFSHAGVVAAAVLAAAGLPPDLLPASARGVRVGGAPPTRPELDAPRSIIRARLARAAAKRERRAHRRGQG